MRLPISLLILLSLCIHFSSSLGELPDNGENLESGETLTSSDDSLILNSGDFRSVEDVTSIDGPTPPSVVAAPLDPLPEMSIPIARPPGFRPPTAFKSRKESEENVNVGFVVRRGRAKVMGFSRRKTESSD